MSRKVIVAMLSMALVLSALALVSIPAPAAAPDAPGNLQFDAGNEKVTLTWSAPTSGDPNITSYIIYRGDSSGSLSQVGNTTNTTTIN